MNAGNAGNAEQRKKCYANAAPEMYEALQKIASMEPGESYDEMCDIYEDCITCDDMISIARAAIRKVRGEE